MKTGSFRGFVEWLSEQAQDAQTAEAAVTEEQTDGVRLLTVHAAKGLEFPVVVLCDPTAPARQEFASRYLDPERGLWAQSLCESEPIELWEQREQVREHDAAEIVRLLYVATTRAQELLVVPVCGDGPIEGWLEVLNPALYPTKELCRTPQPSRYRLPSFGPDSVANRQQEMPSYSVAPGVHVPERGEQQVVFWDPSLLEVAREARAGVAQMHLLQSDEHGARAQAAQSGYQAFRERGQAARTRAAELSLRSSSMTAYAASGASTAAEVAFEIIDTGAERTARARGTRFGSLVHALFEHLDYSEREPDLRALAQGLSRGLGASDLERDSAVQCVHAALAHPFFERVRAAAVRGVLHRELPLLLRAADGSLFDGVIDLAFEEPSEPGPQLCVVDFKTDVELTDPSQYRTQLTLYAEAARQALGLSVTTVLLRV
jgi:ATP-dependent exoDNAse (exonuclease V) beta subunit